MPKVEDLYIENIRLDGDTQPREKIDQDLCAEYGERMKAGDKFPPLDVYFDGTDYWLADGFHRLNASFHALPGDAICCNVYEGTLQDAQWHSYGVNKAHGIRRSNRDKARAVDAALVHPKGQGTSDRQIAEYLGVSHELVRKRRAKLGRDCQKLTVTKRTGRDGRTIETGPIGKTRSNKSPSNAKRATNGLPISRNARPLKRGHSEPCPMIPLQLSPNNPGTAAATLWQHFPREFIRTLIADLSQRLSTEGDGMN